jgi:hypothetical protein
VKTRKITLSLPVELVQQAEVYAAEHNTTLNTLVRELLEEKLSAQARAKAAAERLLQLSKEGRLLSPIDPSTIRREELYERK